MNDAITLLALGAFAIDHMRPAIAALVLFVRLCPAIAMRSINRYPAQATVSPVAGRENLNIKLAQQRPKTVAGALFLRPQCCSMAAVRGQASAWPGANLPGFSPRAQSATICRVRTAVVAPNFKLEHHPMTQHHILTLNPLKARAAAHCAMALAALRADSSLSVRLKRFNAQMAMARALEAQAMEFRRKTDATDTAIELRRSSTKREG